MRRNDEHDITEEIPLKNFCVSSYFMECNRIFVMVSVLKEMYKFFFYYYKIDKINYCKYGCSRNISIVQHAIRCSGHKVATPHVARHIRSHTHIRSYNWSDILPTLYSLPSNISVFLLATVAAAWLITILNFFEIMSHLIRGTWICRDYSPDFLSTILPSSFRIKWVYNPTASHTNFID